MSNVSMILVGDSADAAETGLPSASGLLTCASLPISRWHLAASRKGASEARHAFPLVLIHGAAQTATNWMRTPDGRPGWADFFVGQGYTVYMIDQPARGRSAWQPDIDGKLTALAAERIEQLFAAPETLGNWPQAKKHTQWPGSGRIGAPVFDAFYATQVQYLADVVPTERVPPDARSFRLRSPAW